MDPRLAKDNSQFMSGMKQTVADEKSRSRKSLKEEKKQ